MSELEARAAEVTARTASLDDRAILLEAREAELAESLAALEDRQQELARVREELEAETGRRFFLDLTVKVRNHWRDDEKFLSRLVGEPSE